MNKKTNFFIAMLFLGICCIIISLFIHSDDNKAISGILIGIGTGFVGMSIANFVNIHMENKNPEYKKQSRIDLDDERNILIRNRSKAKAGDITQWLIMIIAYITILISAPLWVTLVVVMVFLLYNILNLYFMSKYQKEM
ncbi:MAG: hypothetical protein K0S61_746 [Anaerocolumna sp.]|jgi:ABC-type Fe3+-siderophore transport system permease subunit|nr:hypothetical protein [Anaerocolumna sp.]